LIASIELELLWNTVFDICIPGKNLGKD